MKKIQLVCLLCLITVSLYSQTTKQYKIKAEYLYGKIFKHNKHLENLVTGPAIGGELAVEFQTMGEKNWHQHFNFPSIGAGLVVMDFSNTTMLGQALALYPYMNIPIIRTDYFSLNVKPGAGVSFLNKRYSNTPHMLNTLNGVNGELNMANAAIGSVMNVFLTFGGNIEVPINRGFSFTADVAWNHVSNGSIVQPNSGINMINAYVGLKYEPNYKNYQKPVKKNIGDIDRKFTFEIAAAGGIRQLYYRDNGRNYPIASLALSVHRPLSNWYRMGAGIDVFYDGVFGAINVANEGQAIDTHFKRTYINQDIFRNKIRAGVSWQHEFIMGRFTAGFHFGVYLYDPIKNLEPYAIVLTNGTQNRGLIYKYNIDKADGWFYSKAVAKYAITEHIFAAISLKTHLQKAEFIEWGLGYRF